MTVGVTVHVTCLPQGSDIDKARNKFMLEVFHSVVKHINFDVVKVVLLGR